MEMTKHQFVKALVQYFEQEWSKNRRHVIGDLSGQITNLLKDLDNTLIRFGYRNEKVHIGNTFGPFGFKVEDKK